MAQQHKEVGFKTVQLFKDQTLGIGAYGKVCRARCDNLDCAAKLLHETLFDTNAEQFVADTRKEHRLPIRRFEKECQFLNVIKHPNIIQYLGMYQDPSSGLAVLLMELMDCNLTSYLETSMYVESGVPFHIQVNICHDITLALSFLHSNGIIHRDLSGNNVLLSGQPNVRAKVTDFGMASLSDQLSPRQTSYLTYTMCPGTDAFMPPEAVKDNPIYTKQIDCFSFGVIVIQILTRKFPKPGDRMKKIEINSPQMSNVTAYVPISEYERRQDHICEIDPENPLQQVALDCLKDRDTDRPTAHWLCERIVGLKDTAMYRGSVAKINLMIQNERLSTSSNESGRMAGELQEQLQSQQQRIQNLLQSCQTQEEQFSRQIAQKDGVIEQQEQAILQKDALLKQKEEIVVTGQRDLQLIRDQLQEVSLEKKHLEAGIRMLKVQHTQEIQRLQHEIQNQVEHFSKKIEQRDEVIKDHRERLDQKKIAFIQNEQTLAQRQQVIDARQREIQLLKEQLVQEKMQRIKVQGRMDQQLSSQQGTPHPQVLYPAPAVINTGKERVQQGQSSFSLRWCEGRNMPCPMVRGCDAVVKGTIVYFMVAGSSHVYNFSITDNTCFSLPDCPLFSSSLAVINDLLTAVGGSLLDSNGRVKSYSNRLYSFTDMGVWTHEKFPNMPTKRDSTLSLNTGTALIVAGGRTAGGGILGTVEVLCTETLQWSTAPSLPMPLQNASGTVCGGNVYLLGGVNKDFFGSKAVFTCSVSALGKLCEPKSLGARLWSSLSPTNPWSRVADLPVAKSTSTSFCGDLLAVGGEDSHYAPTKAIHMYNPMLDSWKVISQMSVARSNCVVASLPGNRLIVGGRAGAGRARNNTIEIASVV